MDGTQAMAAMNAPLIDGGVFALIHFIERSGTGHKPRS
jgi:hypothetical protein